MVAGIGKSSLLVQLIATRVQSDFRNLDKVLDV
jgi:hypothetical protein